ncbi:hypothetical protein [Nocardia sp. BMG111209]|uniref:hypothetical protein n=1 Tax=Nocardia sp. BMG111209 TaxID=1160137 RepID=UPI0012DC42EF|nr:hypothetical protein [Nocardia sp. BMG111209]
MSLAERTDMLFRALHSGPNNEPSAEDVAEAMQGRGFTTQATVLADIRSGRIGDAAPELLAAIAEHFGQEPWYLTDPGDADRVLALHTQLDLLRALRDAGVNRVRLRGTPTSSDRQALIRSLTERQRGSS